MITTEWNAAAYHQINSLQQWQADESLSQLKLLGEEDVLDVGCGDGRVTAEVASRLTSGTALGIDPSHKMVDYARQTYQRPNLSFEYGDARELSYLHRFDRVFSFNALHWLLRTDFPRAMDGLKRSLKPGGRALLRFVGKGPRTALEVVAAEVAEDHASPFTHLTLDEFYSMAGLHGFAVESLSLLDRHWDFEPNGFVEWARTTFVPWTGGMDQPSQDRFIHTVLDRYQQIVGRPDRFAFYQMVSELVLV